MRSLRTYVQGLRRHLHRETGESGGEVPLQVGLLALGWLAEHRDQFNPFSDPRKVDLLKVKALSELSFACLVGLRAAIPAYAEQLRRLAGFALDLVAENELGAVVMENQTLTPALAILEALRQRLGRPPCRSLPAFGPLLAHNGVDSMERCSFQQMDFHYSLRQAGIPVSGPAIVDLYRETLLASLPEVPLLDDWDSYCITHAIFYLTDVGHVRPPLAAAELVSVRRLVQTLVGLYLRRGDLDLLAELLACHHQLRSGPAFLVTVGWRRLAARQRADGSLPGPEFVAELQRQLNDEEAREYCFAVNYHPTLAVLLGAASWFLANASPGPPDAEEPPQPLPAAPRPQTRPLAASHSAGASGPQESPLPSFLEPLWSATLESLTVTAPGLDPFADSADRPQHQPVRNLVHVALLCALWRSRGLPLPAAVSAALDGAERVACDPRLPHLIDSQPREVEYALWLLRLLGPPSGADLYRHFFAQRIAHGQLLHKERTQHRRFLLSWLLSGLKLEHPLPGVAELSFNLLPLHAPSPLALKSGDLKNLCELAYFARAAAPEDSRLPAEVETGLQGAARQLLAIALRGRDLTVLATSLATASLLGVPEWMQHLALTRLNRLYEQQGLPQTNPSSADAWPYLSILLALTGRQS